MFEKIQSKIQDWETIQQTVSEWKSTGQKIVFTNGCFDIVHYGHIFYLSEARGLGDKLVVGVNSDTSVKKLKGEHRPINDEMTRLHLLAALECIDAVVVFEDDTPLELIEIVIPDILVKGGDWQPDQIIGSKIVLDKGGKVKSLAFVDGYSTTAIEEKIRKS